MPEEPPSSPADPNDYGELLWLTDVAAILGVHHTTVYRYAREGKLPTHRMPGGRRYYVFKDELLEWLRSQPGVREDEQAHEGKKGRGARKRR
jgi:excisionase family DNA binding protein